MTNQKTELYFLLFLLLAIFAITFFIFEPFVYPLILAVVFATALDPAHTHILKLTRGRNTLAASISTLLVFFVLVIPLSFLTFQIFQQATGLYSSLAGDGGTTEFSQHAMKTLQNLKVTLNIPSTVIIDVDQYLKQGLDLFINNLGPLLTNVIRIIIDIFLFLAALFYLFRDGKGLKAQLIQLSPLEDQYDVKIIDKIEIAINSIVRGNLTVALVQGVLSSIGFLVFGVPSAILWGGVTAIAAMVPTVGTSLVILPAVLFLFLSGNPISALGLFIWGTIAVGLIDNVLGPKLVGKKVKLNSFLILLSILGGVSFFGPIGFLLGPLSLSLFVTLFEIYFTIRKTSKLA